MCLFTLLLRIKYLYSLYFYCKHKLKLMASYHDLRLETTGSLDLSSAKATFHHL